MNTLDKFALFVYLVFSALTGFVLVDGIYYQKFVTSLAGLILFGISQSYYIVYAIMSNKSSGCKY